LSIGTHPFTPVVIAPAKLPTKDESNKDLERKNIIVEKE
tara:strand:+ start:537 stop:653 length:117 start_codon:yes stop_codon:yes gene_type:complete